MYRNVIQAKSLFPMVKKAALELEMNKPDQWRDDIEEYVANMYPQLSQGLGPCNFDKVDEENGDAIGYMDYKFGDLQVKIPIIIENFILKSPDLGIFKDTIIPLDDQYMQWMQSDQNELGELMYPTSIYDNMTMIESIFHVEDFRRPMATIKRACMDLTMEMAKENVEKANLPEDIVTMVKSASNTANKHEMVDYQVTEINGMPYHYNACILEKVAEDDDHYRFINKVINENDLQKMASCRLYENGYASDGYRSKYVRINIEESNKGKTESDKKIKESGSYDLDIMGYRYRDVSVFSPTYDIISGSSNGKSLCSIEPGSGCLRNEQEETNYEGWLYGELSGSKSEFFERHSMSLNGRIDMSDLENCQGAYITINSGTALSEPMYVRRVMATNVGEIGKQYIIDVETMSHDMYRLWLNMAVQKVTVANKEKMKNNGLGTIASTNLDIYMVPKSYNVVRLIGQKLTQEGELAKKKEEMMDKIAETAAFKIVAEKQSNGKYKMKVVNPNSKVAEYEDLSEEEMIVRERFYLGTPIKTAKEIELGEFYIEDKSPRTYNYSAFDKHRGELFKVASFLVHDQDLNDMANMYATMFPDHKFIKQAALDSLVNNLIGAEFSDNKNLGEVRDVVESLVRLINQIGQLLVLARMSKTPISEPALTRSFYAMTDLVNELRGTNAKSE